MSFASESKRVIRENDKVGAKYCLNAAAKKLKDWARIIDAAKSAKGKEKAILKKDPLVVAILEEYEEIMLLIPQLEKIVDRFDTSNNQRTEQF